MQIIRPRMLALLAPLAALACGDTISPDGPLALSHEISSDELGQALDTAPARVEIKLERGTLVAREVEVEAADEMSDEEQVRGLVTAVSGSGGTGSLTFEMGGLVVTFASTTRFRADDDDDDGEDDDDDGEDDDDSGVSDLAMEEFVGRIEAALAAGVQPTVVARRPAPADPQAPDDPSFEATDLRIRDRAGSPSLQLNVDADNFEPNDAPPPEAWLNVLGLSIEIASTTEIEADDDDRDEIEVEGTVASVDVAAGIVTLTSGAVILITDPAAFDDDEGDDDAHLSSLQAVADALAAGLTVEAEAEGTVQSENPFTLLADEVEFEVEDDDDDDDDGDDDGEDDGSSSA
jgi:hypothetical protein